MGQSCRPSVGAASGAAKTSRFFGHWRGRAVRSTAVGQLGRRACLARAATLASVALVWAVTVRILL